MHRLTLCVLAVAFAARSATAQVHGAVDLVEGKTILWVWGTHHERGYAHGYLLADRVKRMFEDYIVAHVCWGQPAVYSSLRSFYLAHYAVEAPYAEEAEAVLQGVAASGEGLWCALLGRDIDVVDLLVANAIVDLSQSFSGLASTGLGCASLSSWGASTQADSMLQGALVFTRLMDWENHPTLAQHHLMIVSLPSEPSEQPWISLAFPAFIGALSAIGSSGLAATLNVGNRYEYEFGEPFHPILFSVRAGIERRDSDGDGIHTPFDVLAAVDCRNRSSATIIHVARDEGVSSRPLVVECNNVRGVTARDVGFEDDIAGENLAATNHFRALYPPVYCSRYAAISDSVEASAEFSLNRSWDVMIHAAGQPNNLHVIQYAPSRALLRWATSTIGNPAHQREPTTFDIGRLLVPPAGAMGEDQARVGPLRISPNPARGRAWITFDLAIRGPCRLAAYGVDGSLITPLYDGWLDAGPHTLPWPDDVGCGVWILRLVSPWGATEAKAIRIR